MGIDAGGGGVRECRKRARGLNGGPDVLVDADGLVGAPEEAAAEEGAKEGEPVVKLDAGAGQMQLVTKPVDV